MRDLSVRARAAHNVLYPLRSLTECADELDEYEHSVMGLPYDDKKGQ